MTLVSDPAARCAEAADRHELGVSYDADRGEVAVSVAPTGPLQYAVSLATALTAPKLLRETVTDERLDAIGEADAWLREARNIGGLTEAAPRTRRPSGSVWRPGERPSSR